MVISLSWPEAEESQLEFSSRFLTGKELDPDFVAFNSVNQRVHFPARFYLPFRGGFGQLDPLVFAELANVKYILGRSNPAFNVDPTGLLIHIGAASAINEIKVYPTQHDDCECGSVDATIALDASPDKDLNALKVVPNPWDSPNFWTGAIGMGVKFEWFINDDADECRCCRRTGWKQDFNEGRGWRADQKGMKAGKAPKDSWYNKSDEDAADMSDYSADSTSSFWFGGLPKTIKFTTRRRCYYDPDRILYTIDWEYTIDKFVGKWWVLAKINGRCGA
jgi:hypothetical protein